MAKGKSYQRYSASFKKMALTKAEEEGMTEAKQHPIRLQQDLVFAKNHLFSS